MKLELIKVKDGYYIEYDGHRREAVIANPMENVIDYRNRAIKQFEKIASMYNGFRNQYSIENKQVIKSINV